ncbi:drug/metabolite transporter (DMT)-like permease [Novosphingobium gossypii]
MPVDTLRLQAHAPADAAPALWNRPYLLLTLAASLWASNFVLGRALPAGMVPVSLSFWRSTLALPLALPFAWPHLRADLPVLRRGWLALLLLAALGLAGSNTLAYMALRLTDATSALLVQSAMPTAIVACGVLLFRDRVSMQQFGVMTFALVGVLFVVLAKPGAGGALNAGTLLAGAAMLSQSCYATLLRRRPTIHPASFLFLSFAAAAVLMLPFQIAAGTPLPLGDMRAMGHSATSRSDRRCWRSSCSTGASRWSDRGARGCSSTSCRYSAPCLRRSCSANGSALPGWAGSSSSA